MANIGSGSDDFIARGETRKIRVAFIPRAGGGGISTEHYRAIIGAVQLPAYLSVYAEQLDVDGRNPVSSGKPRVAADCSVTMIGQPGLYVNQVYDMFQAAANAVGYSIDFTSIDGQFGSFVSRKLHEASLAIGAGTQRVGDAAVVVRDKLVVAGTYVKNRVEDASAFVMILIAAVLVAVYTLLRGASASGYGFGISLGGAK